MVVKIIRWRPWPPLVSRKYVVRLTVKRLEGCDWVQEGVEKDNGALAVEIRWKGPKISLGSFRRTVKRNCTREEAVKGVDETNDTVLVEWDEEFQSICNLSGYKDNVFHPWEVNFTVFQGLNQGSKNKISIVGSAALNLSRYASKIVDQDTEVKIPLTVPNIAVKHHPQLCVSLNFLELTATPEPTEIAQNPATPLASALAFGETCSALKDEVSAIKASLRRVKIFTDYVSSRRAKKSCREDDSEGRISAKSDEGDYAYSCDSDSIDEFEGESEEGKEGEGSAIRNSFSYGTLAFANYAGVSLYSNARINNDDEDWVYYSNQRRSDVSCSHVEDHACTVPEQSVILSSKRSILPWRKRKLSFRSPKAKGEPLLKKEAYGEEGGDDIDFDRRQLSSDESVSFEWQKTDEESNSHHSSISDFGDDNFAIGTWEQKDITSRDGHMKIQSQAFFASIDQRSERAAGESACTALVAVIANWLHNNQSLMPIKSQFDSLIRDGSLEWRNLCEKQTYKERFPDKHFDLETVLQAKVRDLCVVPGKSLIGFFHPDGMEEGNFDFLHGAMSFDNIWDEITSSENIANGESPVFIVSWNDHFFVLKVESDAYYIIDTLGERLHEGCRQAYILKFDNNTTILKLPSTTLQPPSEEKTLSEQLAQPANSGHDSKESRDITTKICDEAMEYEAEEELICRGKETCKEYIKSFLASIPIRELQADIKKGLAMSTPLHHRLQIEFHFTKLHKQHTEAATLGPETATLAPEAATLGGAEAVTLVLEAATFRPEGAPEAADVAMNEICLPKD